ncbi:glucoamylase precursor [Purpureocillium lilacinum]|uniref:Glucoamylase n=2 Tax=Purpureocillium lilacinum TaxID=33203 RepID=A0A179HM20_PURLI|nr:glucoamylase precursor [Purpureocillium lilacinum]OAQ90519.1 glucoamylase precursor [Purpureocillium lilacinum]PWI68758.1 hypothetical protein PCL_01847 [Purpureocillium lilacinum]GJN68086.1 hypothetical protein PLICBS_002129 [Purpureocillium lilacinum]GJN78244.1 hypothetical protein PLIIFM63780_001737 [Purpureocillium lilacinum]
MLRALVSSLAAIAALQDAVVASPSVHRRNRCTELEDFIKKQNKVSIDGVLANIGPDGSKAKGASPGVVVASPSRSDPDYWYTWSRDAALTFKVLIERFIHGDKSLKSKIDDYVSAQAELQGLTNPSGGPDSGGLGEPKFNVNLTAFTGSWGRPQRDGPALRATALILYANWLVGNGARGQAADKVWPVIAKDLDYTTRFWNRTGYDLWEEINGSSFFTLSASHRALVEGTALAKTLGKTCNDCAASAPKVLCFMQSFWVGGYIDSNINVNDGRTGKDVNSIISSIHTFDPEADCTDATFQPCSARALANHKAVTDSFRTIYAVNKGIPQGKAVAVGRYAEDVYYNGNPWYLATNAAAEQLYAALYQWNRIGSVSVTDVSLPFFKDLIPDIKTGKYGKNSKEFKSIVKAVKLYGDDFLAVGKKYTPADGSLSEQFDRNSGAPESAVDLTWSYASFISATERRAGIMSRPWGERGANSVPAVCEPAPSCDSEVTFNVRVTTVPGEDVFVVGGITELSNWSPANGIPLDASKYTPSDPLWTVKVKIPSETSFEYKYIKKNRNGDVTWESDPNRSGKTGKECNASETINDQWR